LPRCTRAAVARPSASSGLDFGGSAIAAGLIEANRPFGWLLAGGECQSPCPDVGYASLGVKSTAERIDSTSRPNRSPRQKLPDRCCFGCTCGLRMPINGRQTGVAVVPARMAWHELPGHPRNQHCPCTVSRGGLRERGIRPSVQAEHCKSLLHNEMRNVAPLTSADEKLVGSIRGVALLRTILSVVTVRRSAERPSASRTTPIGTNSRPKRI
jgi:hypothetical protein